MSIKPVARAYTYKNNDIDSLESHKALVSSAISVFVHENKVSFVRSNQYSGINRKTQQRWFRWETVHSTGFMKTSTGIIVPYSVSKDSGKFRPLNTDPFAPYSEDKSVVQEYLNYVEKQFGVSDPEDIYPMMGPYGLYRVSMIPYGMRKHFRAPDERAFTKSVFGKSNFRRDLLKATCSSSPLDIVIAKQFNGLVPIDWTINQLRNMHSDAFLLDYRIDKLRKHLLSLDPRSYRRLLQAADHDDSYYIADIIRYGHLPNRALYVRSFREWHDEIWNDRNYHPIKNEPIVQLPLAKELHELTQDDLMLVTAQETSDMVNWSKIMSNCIQGYANTAVKGYGIYGAVTRGTKTIANYEIKNGALNQLLGRFNQSLDIVTKQTAVDMLTSKGVDCSGSWWGK